MSEAECQKVLDILDMYRNLTFSYAGLQDKSGMEAVQFDGFDGNEETQYYAYCRWFCEQDHGRFTELHNDSGFNSHTRRMPDYEQQLGRYRPIEARIAAERGAPGVRLPTKDEIRQVLEG